jgi:hypothetical protein
MVEVEVERPLVPTRGRGSGGCDTESCNARLKASSPDKSVGMISTAYRGIDGGYGISDMRMPNLVASYSVSSSDKLETHPCNGHV